MLALERIYGPPLALPGTCTDRLSRAMPTSPSSGSESQFSDEGFSSAHSAPASILFQLAVLDGMGVEPRPARDMTGVQTLAARVRHMVMPPRATVRGLSEITQPGGPVIRLVLCGSLTPRCREPYRWGLSVADRCCELGLPRIPKALVRHPSAAYAVRGFGSTYGSRRLGRDIRVRSVPSSPRLALVWMLFGSSIWCSYSAVRRARLAAGARRPAALVPGLPWAAAAAVPGLPGLPRAESPNPRVSRLMGGESRPEASSKTENSTAASSSIASLWRTGVELDLGEPGGSEGESNSFELSRRWLQRLACRSSCRVGETDWFMPQHRRSTVAQAGGFTRVGLVTSQLTPFCITLDLMILRSTQPSAEMAAPPLLDPAALDALLKEHSVAGLSIAVLRQDGAIVTQVAGLATREPAVAMFDSTWLEIASLSKTFAAAFCVEYFRPLGVAMDAPVNTLLRDAGSTFVLTSDAGQPPEWAEGVTLAQLVNHSGLGMHYVNGVPLSLPMPPVRELISGSEAAPAPYGYASIDLIKQPGTAFGYSGGGFLVLQYLLELREKKPIAEIMQPFLRTGGTAVSLGLSFDTKDVPGKHYAEGYREDLSVVQDGRLQFPPLAAGALGTPAALLDWLRQLALAYKAPGGCGGISHDTAVQMLTAGPDLGSEAFMRARVGLGVFIFENGSAGAPPSKWMLHQAANDGFRGLYLVCFDGPDAAEGPRGMVVLSNGDNNAMMLNCAVSRGLLTSEAAFSPPL